ncbi:VanZ family protein [Thermoleophilia bacterium SCSIO 60948]|nr:VanZ family protein [Thermoleophilia bacterium SCSIO 60948]
MIRALAPLGLMGLIFFLSSQSDLDTGLGTLDFILRKLGHATIFGALCGLWYWTLTTRLESGTALALAAAIAVLYAMSDELHQSYVTGRTGSALDVAIDSAGVVVAALALRRWSSARARP